jgi:cytoskeletal protein CcmA (bactofilin family)
MTPSHSARATTERDDIPTVVDAGASFEGVLTFRGAVRVDGQITGKIVADGCLVIGPRGKVTATIEVDELIVAGEFEGEATARTRVELLAGGRATGRLRAPLFALADGCRFDGEWHTVGSFPEARSRAQSAPETLQNSISAP